MSVNVVDKSTGNLTKVAGNAIEDAVGIHYSNSVTGLAATNVQSAVDELSSEKAEADIIATAFSAASTYTAGQYCIQDGNLYRFKTTHSGTWSASDVDAVTVGQEVTSLKSGLTNVQSDVKLNTQDLTTVSRTRNLYDKNSEYVLTYINTDTGVMYTSSNATCVYIKCKPNTTYTVSKLAGTRFMVATTRVKPANNVQTYGFIVDFEASSITITTDADAKYLVAYVWANNDEPITREQMLDTVQIEYGSTATTYQQYIESVNARLETVESDVTNLTKSLIYTSESTGTNLSKLQAVKTAYNNLTSERKYGAYLDIDGLLYHVTLPVYGMFSAVMYNGAASELLIRNVELSSNMRFNEMSIKPTGNTFTDLLSEETSSIVRLYA